MAPRLPRGTKPKPDALKTRKTVFEKRFPMVKKKTHELSVLCDISVALICYDTDNNLHVYPENKLDSLRQLLVKFVELSDEKREKHASDLKDFLPSLNSKKKNPITAIESPIDVENMSSDEFWAMISSMDSKFDGWKAKLDRSKNSEVEPNLKETPESFSDEFIASEKNGVLLLETVTDQLGFGVSDELNYLESGSTMFDQSQSVSNFGDSFWVCAEDPNFGVVDTLGVSQLDQFLIDEFCITNNPYQLLNPNPTPIMFNLGVLGNDQFLSNDPYLTNNAYQLSNPNLIPTPIMYNLGVSGSDQVTRPDYQIWDTNPTPISYNLGVSGHNQVTETNYQTSNFIQTPISYNLGVSGHDQVTETDYRMWDPNPTPISCNLGISGHDQVTATDYQMWNPIPTPSSYNFGVSRYDQVTAVDYQMWNPIPTPISYNLGVSGKDQVTAFDSFVMMEPYQTADLNPTPVTSSLEEVSGQQQLIGIDSFPMNESCCQMRDVYPMAETNVLEDGDCLLRAEDMESVIPELLCGDMN